MQDRVPVNPGRVLITPENGGAAYYATMTRADNPTQEGTPLNKNSLLKDATAALFGLGANAVPDDVFGVLSRFQSGLGNEYVWAKVKYETVYEVAENGKETAYLYYGHSNVGGSATIQYADSITATENGLALVNPKSVTVTKGSYSAIEPPTLAGKYVKINNNKTSNVDAFYKISSYYSVSSGTIDTYYVCASCDDAVRIVSRASEGQVVYGYVNSPDSNAYPPAVSDGYTYVALGQMGAKAQIETGSYTGTGTYGASNPNSLTFGFEPKFFAIVFDSDLQYQSFPTNALWCGGSKLAPNVTVTNSNTYKFGICNATLSDKTLSWYSLANDYSQMNYSGSTYRYIAIG